ncbi:MAG: MMPL family transporter [Deltaproteobacteria bacterium]|nr:MMPL family transporter [Deltaproteobacteria bacterium]
MSEQPSFLERLATLQHRRAVLFVVIGLLIGGVSVNFIRHLGLNSAWEALLPSDKPSVHDLERVRDRVGGLSTLTVAIESSDLEAMQRFARDLVPRLKALPPEQVRAVDWNVGNYENFVHEHRFLYADQADLEELRDSLEDRLDYERSKANPFYVQLDDEEPPDPREVIDRLRARAAEGQERLDRFPGGFFVHADHDLLVMFIRTDIRGGDASGAHDLMAAVEREAAALNPHSYAPDLKVELAGGLVMALEEHRAIKSELLMATALTIVGVLLAIFVFFRKVRSIFLLGGALAVPVLVTFAFAQLTIGYLNTSTAFLGSIVIGNGINPNVIWLSRYFEERRRGRDVGEAILRSHRGTWLATMTASAAAAVAYGSLIITDFRGFRDFGIIGGVGMILCWFGAFFLLPAMVSLSERIRPLVTKKHEQTGFYGRLFAGIVYRAPRSIVVVSLVLGLLSTGLVARAVASDPIEYDFRNLKSVREGSLRAKEINDRVGEIVGSGAQGNFIAVVLDHLSDAPAVHRQLEEMADPDAPLWRRVRTVEDLLPQDQEAKIPVLNEIRELLGEYREYADDELRAKIDEETPPDAITAVTAADLPQDAARPFTEKDGTRGRILIVDKTPAHSVWDGRYLMDWSHALRTLRAPDGSRPPLAGRAPVFADMVEVIYTDGPRAIAASFLATLALVLLTFRRMRQRLLTMLTLILGILWMGAAMAIGGMKLNFLNFVAFPITFGNGVDYGVNVMRRYAAEEGREGVDPVRASIEETGGAVILCSLTTVIGYATLYTSANKALNSFGAAMTISELTCLFAAVLTMPAILLLLRRREAKRDASSEQA